MKVGIIGAGKVGTTMGKYLREHDIPVSGFYSRTRESAAKAAEFTQTEVFENLESLIGASDTLFLAVPDGEIRKVWDCIAESEGSGKLVFHFSGSLSSHVFSGIEETGFFGASVHPMYAFNDPFTSYQNFSSALLVAEGQQKAVEAIQTLFGKTLGHRVLQISAEDKLRYHAAASLVSNGMAALYDMSAMLLGLCGFSEEESGSLLAPLVEQNVHAILKHGAVEALTGPIERNDVETVKKHGEAILKMPDSDEDAANRAYNDFAALVRAHEAYGVLSRQLAEIAKKKHPDRDYSKLTEVLKRI